MATIKSFDPEKRNRQMRMQGAITEKKGKRYVTIQDLTGLTVPEQTQLLRLCGYQQGALNPYGCLSMREWNLVATVDTGYINENCFFLRGTEKITIPFVLKNDNGTVIDEYNYCWLYYYKGCEGDPHKLIAEFWIRGSCESAITMPISSGRRMFNGNFVLSNSALGTHFTLTAHDLNCFEDRVSERFSELPTRIITLENGRYALATKTLDNGRSWMGFPACGDGDETAYFNAILSHMTNGIDTPTAYEIGVDDCVTFETKEEAQRWSVHIGLDLEE